MTRLDNLIEATASAGGDDRFWFATYQPLLVDRDPLPLFWHAPWRQPSGAQASMADYLAATEPSLVAS
jgi:hypothetical protein